MLLFVDQALLISSERKCLQTGMHKPIKVFSTSLCSRVVFLRLACPHLHSCPNAPWNESKPQKKKKKSLPGTSLVFNTNNHHQNILSEHLVGGLKGSPPFSSFRSTTHCSFVTKHLQLIDMLQIHILECPRSKQFGWGQRSYKEKLQKTLHKHWLAIFAF